MKINVETMGILRIHGLQRSRIEIEKGTTISGLLGKYGISAEQQKYILLVVNGKSKNLSYVLNENDHLYLISPVGGG